MKYINKRGNVKLLLRRGLDVAKGLVLLESPGFHRSDLARTSKLISKTRREAQRIPLRLKRQTEPENSQIIVILSGLELHTE